MKYRILTTILGLFLVASPVWADGGPWNFMMQLPAKDAGMKIDRPIAIAIDDESKRYYVVDVVGGALVSFDRAGKHLAAFNAGGELKHPVAMAKGLGGALWVIERSSNQVLHVNPREQQVRSFSLTYPDGSLIFPARLAVDGQGRLLVLDRMRGAVVRLDDNLKVEKTFAGQTGSKGFVDFKIKGNELWALDGLAGKVYRFAGDGAPTTVDFEPRLEFPFSLEVDEGGQLYILDRHAGTVAVFGPRGDFRFDFLGRGKRHGKLWYPAQLLFDWEGRLCIVDEGNNRVDIFSR
jgi:sugar lactone lactonase YvrE